MDQEPAARHRAHARLRHQAAAEIISGIAVECPEASDDRLLCFGQRKQVGAIADFGNPTLAGRRRCGNRQIIREHDKGLSGN